MSRQVETALDDLLALVSSEGGISANELRRRLASLFAMSRSEEEINDYRFSRGKWKKFADEIVPVSRFLAAVRVDDCKLRFPLDDQPPDCWIWDSSESEPCGIEVTIAQARERHELAKELVNDSIGRGFIGLPDAASTTDYRSSLARSRIMFTSAQAIAATQDGILTCFAKKDRPQYAGMTLIIQAPLGSLPSERWTPMFGKLKPEAQRLPFREVHLIGNRDSNGLHCRLK